MKVAPATPVFDPNAAAAPGSGIFGLPEDPQGARVHVLGVPFDATTSFRKGTARGPAAILAASRQVDLFDALNGRPYEAGIWMAPLAEEVLRWNEEASRAAEPVIEAGGVGRAGGENADGKLRKAVERVDSIQEELNRWVEARANEILD
ncbi:MAG TPA: arginase family protein, partial [Planctomycetota bacterium]